jgi:ABC-type nitrate/sulfonate/bicarbonate transport system permease component
MTTAVTDGPALVRVVRPVRKRWPDWVWTLIGIVVILSSWQVYGLVTNPFLFPTVTRVLDQIWYFLVTGVLLTAFWETAVLLFVGLAIGTALGILFGLIIGANRKLSDIVAPFVQAAYATPRIALIPLIMIWFGVGFQAQVVLVVLSCLFEVLTATEAGVQQVVSQYREVARSFRLSRLHTFTKVVLPGSVSYIFSGMRLGLGNAFIGALGAQMFMQATGLGAMVRLSSQMFRTDQVMAVLVTLSIISALLMWAMRHAERRLAPWRTDIIEG